MTFEHWQNEDGDTFLPADTKEEMKVLACGEGAKLCCVIEADSWEKGMTKYHEHQGWEPYVPFEEREVKA